MRVSMSSASRTSATTVAMSRSWCRIASAVRSCPSPVSVAKAPRRSFGHASRQTNPASTRRSIAGEPARREAGLCREVGHPQLGPGGARQAHEHLEGKSAEAQLGLDPRRQGTAQAASCFEHQPGERDPGRVGLPTIDDHPFDMLICRAAVFGGAFVAVGHSGSISDFPRSDCVDNSCRYNK